VKGPTDEEFEAFTKECDSVIIPRELAKHGCMKSEIGLAYEKKHDRIVFMGKKRYVARYAHFGRDSATGGWNVATAESKPEVKGLEYKRGDASRLTTTLQTEIVDLLVGGLHAARGEVPTEDVSRYHEAVSRMRAHVLEDNLPLEEIVISKGLSKDLDDYAVKEGREDLAHVKIGKELRERGEDVREGTRVEFVVTDASVSPMKVIPAADYQQGTEIDRHYVWEKVWEPTERVLKAAFPDEDWGAWGKTRPAKGRGGALAGQLAVGQPPPPLPGAPPPASGPLSAQRPPPAEFVILVDQGRVPRGLAPVHAILKRHPGKRPAVLRLRLEDGKEALLGTMFRVSGSEALAQELRPYRQHGKA